MSRGPQILICGSRLSDERYMLRCLLEGYNAQGRQWQETIVIQDDGSLEGLEHELEDYKYLEHRRVDDWDNPNIVLCFIDQLSQNRASERLLAAAAEAGIPAFVISPYIFPR